jgi:hypothetical protein
MTTLNNPITSQNIVNRFADFVTATANANIVWGTDALPFSQFNSSNFGGTISGTTVTATGSSIQQPGLPNITAANIVSALLAETQLYTNIRNLNAILNVTGGGGNNGSYSSPGIIFNSTSVAYMNTSYRQTLNSVDISNVSSGNKITVSGLETFFTNMQTEYTNQRANTTTIQVDVCHASCHSSCHSSRSRR